MTTSLGDGAPVVFGKPGVKKQPRKPSRGREKEERMRNSAVCNIVHHAFKIDKSVQH